MLEAFQVRCRPFWVRNLRVVMNRGLEKLGRGDYWAFGNLTHSTKHNASFISRDGYVPAYVTAMLSETDFEDTSRRDDARRHSIRH
uniref:SFRICE_023806 n=1 Tax=Spodoptera frugiperda TaxID=7108 RepID=A0A2H1V3U5_SPOFR